SSSTTTSGGDAPRSSTASSGAVGVGSPGAPTGSGSTDISSVSSGGPQLVGGSQNSGVSIVLGSAGGTRSSSRSPADSSTTATPVASSDSTTAPTSATLPSIDPASNPGSGPSPPVPAPWTLSLADSSAHTISVAADATSLTLTVDGSTSSRPL